MNEPSLWSARADLAQHGLDHFFGTSSPQLLNNSYPAGDNTTFNYWWLAHAVDVRLDAFARTGDTSWLVAARQTSENLRERNGGELFNDYFDDMLWYALALVRLAASASDERYLADARRIWKHVLAEGWNDRLGGSVAWRKQQLEYKNTPANGPFAILSARLHALDGDAAYLEYGQAAFDWITRTLVGPDGFVEDGINREGDGRIDHQWRFSYNQGLYVGAAVALSDRVADQAARTELLELAARTARTAVRELAPDGVIGSEGDGGDEGLFKGVFYRYLGTLLTRLDAGSEAASDLSSFVRTSTDHLWETGQIGGHFLAGSDWRHPATLPVNYSTQLSAIMALELRATLETGARAEDLPW